MTPRPTLPVDAEDGSLLLTDGPHLLLYRRLIDSQQGLVGIADQPERTHAEPIIPGVVDGSQFDNVNFQSAVLHDEMTGRFRMWYQSYDRATNERFTAYTESPDGIGQWTQPIEISRTRGTGDKGGQLWTQISSVWDEGADFQPAAERYKTVVTAAGPPPRWQADAWHSADGISWSSYRSNPITVRGYGEHWVLFYDSSRARYVILHRWNQKDYEWVDSEGVRRRNTINDPFVRGLGLTYGPRVTEFPESRVATFPDERDEGETQIYNISNVIRRGDLWLAMVSILRDDLKASDSPDYIDDPYTGKSLKVYGTGYTVLAWSRDGVNWNRHRHQRPYFEPDPDPQAWDHAVAWITAIVPVGDDVLLYYGGYQYGHKNYIDRHIGLLRIRRDRYFAMAAVGKTGWLRTVPVRFDAERLTLNVDASEGQVRVRFVDTDGNPLPGYDFENCAPVTGDALDAPLVCENPLLALREHTVQIEFELTNARLYAFSIEES
jgi:hypothetical protein